MQRVSLFNGKHTSSVIISYMTLCRWVIVSRRFRKNLVSLYSRPERFSLDSSTLRHVVPAKCWQKLTQWQSVTSQNTQLSKKPQWKPQISQTRSLWLHSSSFLRDRKYSPLCKVLSFFHMTVEYIYVYSFFPIFCVVGIYLIHETNSGYYVMILIHWKIIMSHISIFDVMELLTVPLDTP